MPYVDLHSGGDYASIYYTTSTMFDNVGGFDSEKPTVVLLHPLLLDSSWLHCQFGDPRLYMNYNLIAFDMRSCGKSNCKPSSQHDSWVDAADLAFCHQMLHLPACHIFAFEGISVNCALRFAILFPEMCLSLALCNIPAPVENKWAYTGLEELLQTWCFSEDLETIEHAGMEGVALILGPDCEPDLQDELIAFWQKVIPPARRPWIIETINVLINRPMLNPDLYTKIEKPVLIIHGERNESCPKEYAEYLASQLKSAEAVLFTIRGASGYLSIVPGSASIANQTFAKFLSRLPPTRSDLIHPNIPIQSRMTTALEKLSTLMGNPKIKSLDPMSSLSFSCLSDGLIKAQAEVLSHSMKDRHKSYSPLGPDGRPFRKFSEAKTEHWFQSGKDGLSIADTNFLLPERGKPDQDRTTLRPDRDNRLVKPTLTPATVEKLIIKGSMANIVGKPSTTFSLGCEQYSRP